MGERWDNIKGIAKDLPYQVKDQQKAMIMSHYYASWAKICNPDMDEKVLRRMKVAELTPLIDFSNPHVSLQMKLCDPYWQKAIKNDKGRAEFLSILTDEERDLYLNYVDENGARYSDLENARITKELVKATKRKIATLKKRKNDDDIEQV